jgi:hypothetical protein
MASNAVLVLPDAFKSIKPYITLADQLEQKNERAISYYCMFFLLEFLPIQTHNFVLLPSKQKI